MNHPMNPKLALALWLMACVCALVACVALQGCASVAHPVSGPEMVAQDGPEVTYAEVREACDRPAYRTRARHTPVYTERGYAVWCY